MACVTWHTVSLPASQKTKPSLKSMLRNNIAIITSYNDMLSAHQPYEHYPEIIRKALHEANAVVRLRVVFRRCVMGTEGQDGSNCRC
ncbi:hypothetical protein ACLK1T_25190 [Escherichia coli]